MDKNNNFDWADLAFASKKDINNLKPVFIAAPRSISPATFTKLIKQYLPIGNILLGISKEEYVVGLEGQPHFYMLKLDNVKSIIDKVNNSASPHKIYTIQYFQRETNYLIQKLKFSKVVFIRGSWQYAFHNLPIFYSLVNKGINYELVSPFTDEIEAKKYDKWAEKQLIKTFPEPKPLVYSEVEMVRIAADVAKFSFDYNFQTGIALARKSGKGYKYVTRSFNKIVPYQTYALLNGASREVNFSPPHDLNHYDTVHAEVNLIIKAQKEKINLGGTTVFINLLPCPACARMFTQTDIDEFVYSDDHSGGYAIKMLEAGGKKVRRIVL